MFKVQSVLLPKNKYTYKEAQEWIKKHGYKIKHIDITSNLYRFRQLEPSYIERLGYKNYHNKKLNNDIILVLAYK